MASIKHQQKAAAAPDNLLAGLSVETRIQMARESSSPELLDVLTQDEDETVSYLATGNTSNPKASAVGGPYFDLV